MKKILSIGLVNTLRFLREKSNIFFVFVFPLMIVLLLGVAFGGGFDARLGVHVEGDGGPLASEFVDALDDLNDISVVRYDDAGAMVDAVQRGNADGGVTIPAGYDEALAAGDSVVIEFVSRPDQGALLLRETVREAVADQARPILAGRVVSATGVAGLDEAVALAAAVPESVDVRSREAGDSLFEGFEALGQFDLGASQQLVLFMFLTSLAGSAELIQTRKLGVARRMLSTPTSARTILLGETAGRYSVALTQGLYIMVGTLLIFGVDWGDPIAAPIVVLVFALVGTGAAMLMGSLFSNDQQAGGLGVLIGLGLAAIGGAMAPIEVFPDTMQTVAKATPHAWAIDAFAELVRRDGTLVDVLPHLGVLAGFAVAFLSLASWRLQRVLTR